MTTSAYIAEGQDQHGRHWRASWGKQMRTTNFYCIHRTLGKAIHVLTWTFAYSKMICFSVVISSAAICFFVLSGRMPPRLSYTRTCGCSTPTVDMVIQWLPPECKICTASSGCTLNTNVWPNSGFWNPPTGSRLSSSFIRTCAAWITLSFNHFPSVMSSRSALQEASELLHSGPLLMAMGSDCWGSWVGEFPVTLLLNGFNQLILTFFFSTFPSAFINE